MDRVFNIENIRLIIGLGNIGKEYINTPHNIGFMFLDFLSSDFNEEKKFKAFISTYSTGSNKMTLAKPSTMMNRSGESVNLIANYYNIKPDEILVAHDDLDIKFSEFKLQFAKSPKGHNGIISIENILDTDEFWRLRIGVDNRSPDERDNIPGMKYVLSKMPQKQIVIISEIFDKMSSRIFENTTR